MKIAMVTPWADACGIADYSAALVEGLQAKVEVEIIPLEIGQTRPAYFRELGLRCNQADIVHIQHEYIYFGGIEPWNYRFADLLAGIKRPWVMTLHTWLRPGEGGPLWKRVLRAGRALGYRLAGWSRYLDAGQFRQARVLFVHNPRQRNALLQQGFPEQTISLLPHGVPFNRMAGNAAIARQQWGLKGPLVLMAGFVNPAKGHLLALEAWRQLNHSQATLVIAGKPFSQRDEAYAKAVTRQAGQQLQTVRQLGFLSERELTDLLAAAEVVLLPYLSGNASGILARALAQGCVVLASDIEYFREMNRELPCLQLFETGNRAMLVEQLQALLGDAARRRRLSQAAGAWAEAHAWDKVAKKTIQVYSKLAG